MPLFHRRARGSSKHRAQPSRRPTFHPRFEALEERRVLANASPYVDLLLPDQTATPTLEYRFAFFDNFRDPDVGDTLSYSAGFTYVDDDGTPSNWLSLNPTTRTFSGTPSFTDLGHVDVTVTATDTGGSSVSDTFTVTVPGGNHAPVVIHAVPAQTAYVDESFAYQFPDDAIVDVDPGDSISYSVSELPAWLSFDPSPSSRTFSGMPKEVSSPVAVDITATDNSGASASLRLQIFVLPPNAPPTARAIPDQSFNANESVYIPLSGIFSDPGDFLTVEAIYPPWLDFISQGSSFVAFSGVAPPSGDYPVSLTATDTRGQSVTTGFTVHVISTSDSTVAVDDSYSITEDSVFTVAAPGVLSNDTPAFGLTAVLVTAPAHGFVALTSDGSLTYMPAVNYCGTDSFTYQATNGLTSSVPAVVTMNVSCLNDRPVAVGESYNTTENGVLTVNAPGVLANDADADGDALTAVLVRDVAHGAIDLSSNGGFTYTPAAGFAGTDSFIYRAHDGTNSSEDTVVSIQVAPRPILQGLQIDVRPVLNLRSEGVIAVKIFSTADFHATDIKIASLRFEGAASTHFESDDLNRDGQLDLVVHFRIQDTALLDLYKELLAEDLEDGDLDSKREQLIVSLTGETVDGAMLEGFDCMEVFLKGNSLEELLDELAASGAI